MKLTQLILLTVLALGFSSCSKLNSLIDTPAKLDDMTATTHQMKEGMDKTNEAIRLQKIGVALSEMQKKQNREYLTPIPGDMMPAGKILAESLTSEEAMLFMKDYIKKINEENFNNRYPELDPSTDAGKLVLKDFEHDKLADLMMITIVAGYLPQTTLNELISTEADQGAYTDIFYQTLMLRVIFHNDLMLNASVMNEKLSTLGKINKAIEYNSKVDFVAKLDFADQVELKITGFSNPEMNAAVSQKLNPTVALKNWTRIYTAAQSDFKATSFSKNDSEKAKALQIQNAQYAQVLNNLQGLIKSWGAAVN